MKRLACPLLLILCLLSVPALAQPVSFDQSPQLANANTSLLGISILGNPKLTFSSVEDYTSGVTADHGTLQLSLSLGLLWTLQVRVAGDLQSGTQTIPASTISIQPLNLLNNTSILNLTTVNQTLITGGLNLGQLLTLSPIFRYRAQGGSAFLKPAGTYTTTLVFTFAPL